MELPVDYTNISYRERWKIREEYIKRQGGDCYYCKHPLDREPPKEIKDKRINKKLFPKGFFKYPQHLHHDHTTKMTIGTVHCYCNAILWQYHNE